jgi:hypothetical protein
VTGKRIDLAARLMESAGDREEQTAIAVLATHGRWLHHPSFLSTCVCNFRDRWWIDWRRVRRLLTRVPCSIEEEDILLLAGELVEWRSGRRLRNSRVLARMRPSMNRQLWEVVGTELAERPPQRGRR